MILVTGATGNIGRKVVGHLVERGARDVRALTTDPARARLPPGVEVARGYLRRVETLPAALEGVDTMYLAPTPDTVTEVVELARAAGVRRIVDLSGEPESWWGDVTRAVEAGGVAWTHLWPGDFMENTEMWAPQIRDAAHRTRDAHEGRARPAARCSAGTVDPVRPGAARRGDRCARPAARRLGRMVRQRGPRRVRR
jgi:uncharacterized protein YbjT (DUF2867 family)